MSQPYLYNFKELCFINASTTVLIVHLERPFELMLQFTPQDKIQCCHIFQKINGIVLDVVQRQRGKIISLGKISLFFQRQNLWCHILRTVSTIVSKDLVFFSILISQLYISLFNKMYYEETGTTGSSKIRILCAHININGINQLDDLFYFNLSLIRMNINLHIDRNNQ